MPTLAKVAGDGSGIQAFAKNRTFADGVGAFLFIGVVAEAGAFDG